jgi:hypothetical protein
MAIPSTLSSQVGFAVESVAGTRQAPTKWAEVRQANGSFGRKTLRSKAANGGSAFKKPHLLLGQEPALHVVMEASAENIGPMLRLCLGAPVTTGPVTTIYTHTFNWLLTVPLPTATFQLGMTSIDGTTRPFDWIGMMVSTWELGITPDEYVLMTYDLVGRRGVTDQTLGTPTYPTLTGWTSLNATLNILGGVECFTALSIRGDNQLDISSVVCGTNPGERKVRQAGGPMITGSFDQDFEDMTLFNAFVAGTPGALTLTLTNGTSIMTVTGRVQFVEDSTPGIEGEAQVIGQTIPFEFVRDGSNTDAQTFQVALQTTVATV